MRIPSLCQRGISLIELVVFITVVSVAVAGVLSVMNTAGEKSADPVARKQALAVAEGLLEEVTAQPFTWCDPDDTAVTTATSAGACLTAEAMGPEAGESRYAVPMFDNVNDYDGLSMSGIRGVADASTVLLAGYGAEVSVTQVGSSFGLADNAAALRIDVRVHGNGEDITLTGYRFRHSPNSAG